MASPAYSKAKGREAENDVVSYLQGHGFEQAERRRLAGAADRGDVAGVPGWTVEVKAGGSRVDVPRWLRELAEEQANTGDRWGLVVVRPKGMPDPERFWAIQPLEQAVRLMKALEEVRR